MIYISLSFNIPLLSAFFFCFVMGPESLCDSEFIISGCYLSGLQNT